MDMLDTYSLKGICMLMIMFHHVLKLFPGCPESIMRWGYLGVAVFFLVSGWGMYSSMAKKEDVTLGYFGRQMKKLLIPYLIAFPLSESLYYLHHADFISFSDVICDLCTLSFSPVVDLWFFKVIVATYVISILTFILVMNRLARLAIVSMFGAAYYIVAWKILKLPLYWYGTSLCIVAGMWMAAYKNQLQKIYDKKIIIFVCAIVAYYITLHYNLLPIPSRTVHSFAFAIAMVAAVSIFNFANPIMDYIGRNSLLFYLIHVPLCELLAPPPFEFLRLKWIALGIVLILTAILTVSYNQIKIKLQK